MEINDLGEKFKELADKMDERIKDPEEKKKFRAALDSPELLKQAKRVTELIKAYGFEPNKT